MTHHEKLMKLITEYITLRVNFDFKLYATHLYSQTQDPELINWGPIGVKGSAERDIFSAFITGTRAWYESLPKPKDLPQIKITDSTFSISVIIHNPTVQAVGFTTFRQDI